MTLEHSEVEEFITNGYVRVEDAFARAQAGAQESRNGIRIVPDRVAASWSPARVLPAIGTRQPALALDEALNGIAARYGERTADFVAMQLEYPRERGSASGLTVLPAAARAMTANRHAPRS